MDILYDHQIFSMQRFGGISRYFQELHVAFSQYPQIHTSISLKYSNNFYLENTASLKTSTFFKNYSFKGKHKLLYYLNKRASIKALKSQDFKVFHPTYYYPYFLSYLKKRPYVVTVHDLIHEIYPDLVHKKDYSRLCKEKILPGAKRIIAISQQTRNDLLRYYKVDEDKVDVIFHGAPKSVKNPQPVNNIDKKFILFVGKRGLYKNFNRLLQAIASTLKTYDLQLICVGGGAFSEQEKIFIQKLDLSSKVKLLFLDDDELAYCYQKAELFVFPSLYEGFGMPILEAFTNNCPIAISKASCFPEVAGDAAMYFDAQSESSMKNTVETMLNSPSLCHSLVAKGRERVKLFSWAKTAEQTLKCYQHAT